MTLDLSMRASDTYTESLFTMSKLEDFIPQSHPLRPIRKMVNEALTNLECFLTTGVRHLGRDFGDFRV